MEDQVLPTSDRGPQTRAARVTLPPTQDFPPGRSTKSDSVAYQTQPIYETATEVNEGNDAVCFTAGFSGAVFGAGTIHAYLASDRAHPLIAAGISMGALNAAAMQRCYQELIEAAPKGGEAKEIARWTWFRKYLEALCDNPLGAIWNGLPKQSDFFADMIPVKDPTVDEFSDNPTQNGNAVEGQKWDWKSAELKARRELYLFMKLGNWLAALPISISRVANTLVNYVRSKEKQKDGRWYRPVLNAYLWQCLLIAVLWHICATPKFFPEGKFRTSPWRKLHFRPLLGWLTYVVAVPLLPISIATFLVFLALIALVLQAAVWCLGAMFAWSLRNIVHYFFPPKSVIWLQSLFHRVADSTRVAIWWKPWLARLLSRVWTAVSPKSTSVSNRILNDVFIVVCLSAALFLVLLFWYCLKSPSVTKSVAKYVLHNLELERALVNDFHLRLKLTRLFGEQGVSPFIKESPMKILIVAAPLQCMATRENPLAGSQVWAKNGTSLVDALYAAIAQPGLFKPLHLERGTGKAARNQSTLDQWISGDLPKDLKELDLVDGNVVRQNPIPAFFSFLKESDQSNLRQKLCSDGDARVHVIYNVPLHGPTGEEYPTTSNEAESSQHGMNIVQVARMGLRLNKRRDTSVEVEQTNFISLLARTAKPLAEESSASVSPIFADEIAPEKEITFKNRLAPQRGETLTHVASGCRKTLECLYKKELSALPATSGYVPCRNLLTHVAKDRKWPEPFVEPGLAEICGCCTRQLVHRCDPDRPPVTPDWDEKFEMLSGKEPRIVFVASGGVFRGPFHGGMLACLLAAQIRPDMIIGNSVGTLMGGALAAVLSAKDYESAVDQLAEVTETFVHVDQRIAFTKPLKSAVRELGIRARSIRLSPRRIRQLIRKGSHADPGFAATGAPSALIDAMSDLLMIPHRKTSQIAAQFVAGRVSTATKALIDALSLGTLRRLDIEFALIGTSLLEPTARKLLGEGLGLDLNCRQPYVKHGIAFFGTTTDLFLEKLRVLGSYIAPGGELTYDFLEAALSSSAFPAVFSPRRESDIFPGVGRTNVLFSDGGMFDNLPFIPAIRLLGSMQHAYRAQCKNMNIPAISSKKFLSDRHQYPDLFIAGSLNIRPESDPHATGPFDTLLSVHKRSAALEDNVKIRSFEWTAAIVNSQIHDLVSGEQKGDDHSDPKSKKRDDDFMDGIVDAAVLPVFPADQEHLNPTFAFCASTGLKPKRVQDSISDGCFQTFAAIADALKTNTQRNLVGRHLERTVAGLVNDKKRLPKIAWFRESGKKSPEKGDCPFFEHSADTETSQKAKRFHTNKKETLLPFQCPFYAMDTKSGLMIYNSCRDDSVHLKQEKKVLKRLAKHKKTPEKPCVAQ